MNVFAGEPGLVMLFLAQVLFIVLQIIILMRLSMEMNESHRGKSRATVSRARAKRKSRR
ncbi:MAG: hypothetical protein AABX02_02220 [archaeon]